MRVSCCVAGRHQPGSRARHAIHQHGGRGGFVQHVGSSCPTASVLPRRHTSWLPHVSRTGRRAAFRHAQRDGLLARAPLRVGRVWGAADRTGRRPSLRPAPRQGGGGVRTTCAAPHASGRAVPGARVVPARRGVSLRGARLWCHVLRNGPRADPVDANEAGHAFGALRPASCQGAPPQRRNPARAGPYRP